nr:glutathione-S-transferase [Aphelinus asychis]
MSLKLYYDLLSQPSRALYIFLKVCNIPFESKIVNLSKGEQFQPGFEKIHRFNKVPAIEHNGFNLIESVAIMRYLCREFKVDEHWYPRDSNSQARVDEYLEWQHLNTRIHCALYFQIKFLIPLLKGSPPKPEQVAKFEDRMIECLDQMENIWLKDTPFLIGDQISIADILGACEVEQPRMAGFNPRDGRPNLSAWLDRVAKETSPYYEEAHKRLNKLAARSDQKESKL